MGNQNSSICNIKALELWNLDTPSKSNETCFTFSTVPSSPGNPSRALLSGVCKSIQGPGVGFGCVWHSHYFVALRFTVRCTLVQSAVLRSHISSVCLSVCPSVCNVGGLWSHRLEFFENNFTISLGCSLFATPTWRVYSKRNTLNLGPKWPTLCWFERRRHSIANCGRMVTDSATVAMESL